MKHVMAEKQSLEASMKAKSSEELANGGASSSAALFGIGQ